MAKGRVDRRLSALLLIAQTGSQLVVLTVAVAAGSVPRQARLRCGRPEQAAQSDLENRA
jgi:hypothetical protein